MMVVAVAVVRMRMVMTSCAMMMFMATVMRMFRLNMDVKLCARNSLALLLADMQVIAIKFQLGEFVSEHPHVHAQINKRAIEHIPADAAENIEIKRLHSEFNSAINKHGWT